MSRGKLFGIVAAGLASTLILAGIVTFTAAGCAQSAPTAAASQQSTVPQATETQTPANARCPMMGGSVHASAGTRQFEGKTVGFCCPGCPAKWDQLTDAQKKAKLTASAGN
ncbi:MAG: hypothetical protein BIFFINMI_03831 [Phycisphaerae bacterium]|nr:hypothetical protein [Phycisphaerae bacterium]